MANAGSELLSAFKSKLSSRIDSASGFVLKHTDDQISAIIEKGKALGLSDDVIDDLLFISCREAKLIDADGLMKQMDNWVNVVQKLGYPYKFADISEFNKFKSELKSGLDNIGVSSADVRIQGSSLRTPDANDVDLAVIIDDVDFDNFLVDRFSKRMTKNKVEIDLTGKSKQELVDIATDVVNNTSAYTGQGKSFAKAMIERKISAYSSNNIVPGAKALYKTLKSEYTDLNIENISIQTTGGSLDLKPFIKL